MRKEIAEQGLKLAADAQQAPAQNTEKQTEKREKKRHKLNNVVNVVSYRRKYVQVKRLKLKQMQL